MNEYTAWERLLEEQKANPLVDRDIQGTEAIGKLDTLRKVWEDMNNEVHRRK